MAKRKPLWSLIFVFIAAVGPTMADLDIFGVDIEAQGAPLVSAGTFCVTAKRRAGYTALPVFGETVLHPGQRVSQPHFAKGKLLIQPTMPRGKYEISYKTASGGVIGTRNVTGNADTLQTYLKWLEKQHNKIDLNATNMIPTTSFYISYDHVDFFFGDGDIDIFEYYPQAKLQESVPRLWPLLAEKLGVLSGADDLGVDSDAFNFMDEEVSVSTYQYTMIIRLEMGRAVVSEVYVDPEDHTILSEVHYGHVTGVSLNVTLPSSVGTPRAELRALRDAIRDAIRSPVASNTTAGDLAAAYDLKTKSKVKLSGLGYRAKNDPVKQEGGEKERTDGDGNGDAMLDADTDAARGTTVEVGDSEEGAEAPTDGLSEESDGITKGITQGDDKEGQSADGVVYGETLVETSMEEADDGLGDDENEDVEETPKVAWETVRLNSTEDLFGHLLYWKDRIQRRVREPRAVAVEAREPSGSNVVPNPTQCRRTVAFSTNILMFAANTIMMIFMGFSFVFAAMAYFVVGHFLYRLNAAWNIEQFVQLNFVAVPVRPLYFWFPSMPMPWDQWVGTAGANRPEDVLAARATFAANGAVADAGTTATSVADDVGGEAAEPHNAARDDGGSPATHPHRD